jgi:hypothetical protein
MAGQNRRYYRAKATSWAFGMTQGGKQQLGVAFDVLEEGVPDQEKRLAWYGSFSDAAFDRTIESLRILGWEGEDLTELDEGGPGRLDVNEVSLVVEDEEYPEGSGQWTVKVQFVNKPGGGAVVKNRMAPEDVKSFAAQMRGKIRALNASQGKATAPVGQQRQPQPRPAPAPRSAPRPPPQRPEPPPEAYDEDIPF